MVNRKIKKFSTIIFIISLLFSCISCSAKVEKEIVYKDKIVNVEVPVMYKPQFERPKKPIYYIEKLNKNSTPKEVAEAYVNTIKEQKSYIKKLEIMIEPFYKDN